MKVSSCVQEVQTLPAPLCTTHVQSMYTDVQSRYTSRTHYMHLMYGFTPTLLVEALNFGLIQKK